MTSLATPEPANRATFTDINGGDILTVATYGDANVLVRFDRGPQGQSDLAGIIVSADHAPAVALAILTAAGVQPHHGTSRCIGDRMDMWAVRYLTDHVEAQAEDAAEKELTRRRDELAAKLGQDRAYTYEKVTPGLRIAIDMITQLQDEATK